MDKGVKQSWQVFKEALLSSEELPIPRCSKSGKEGKRSMWLNWHLMVKLESKKKMHRQWQQMQVTSEEYRSAARMWAWDPKDQGPAGTGFVKGCKEG